MARIEDRTVFEADIATVLDAERDILEIRAPLGPLGWLADVLFLKACMTAFLRKKKRGLKALMAKGVTGHA